MTALPADALPLLEALAAGDWEAAPILADLLEEAGDDRAKTVREFRVEFYDDGGRAFWWVYPLEPSQEQHLPHVKGVLTGAGHLTPGRARNALCRRILGLFPEFVLRSAITIGDFISFDAQGHVVRAFRREVADGVAMESGYFGTSIRVRLFPRSSGPFGEEWQVEVGPA